MRRLLFSPAAAPAVAACVAALLLAAALPGLSTKTTRVWKGFYTLVLREDAVSAEAAARALARVSPGAVWEGSVVVEVSDLEGSARVPYAQLASRLDPEDPRFDPWLRGLAGWLRVRAGGRSWRVAFLPAGRTSTAVHRQLRRELGPQRGGRWRLAEYDPLEKWLALGAAVAAAAAMTRAARRGRAGRVPAGLAAAAAACWVPFLASGGIAELCVVLAALPGWLRVARQRRVLRAGPGGGRDSLAGYAAAVLAGLAVLFVVAGFSWFRLLGGLLAAASSVVLLALRRPAAALRRSMERHRVFPAVPRLASLRARLPSVRALVCGIAALPFLLVLVPQLRGLSVPVPVPLAGARGFTWDSIARLAAARQERTQGLPDLSDYVAHKAWQQSLVFGRPFGLPAPGERVTVPEYVQGPSGAIVPRARTVKSFDAAWLAHVLCRPAEPNVEGVLLAQGAPVLARQGRGRPALLGDLLCAALCAGALAAWFAGSGARPGGAPGPTGLRDALLRRASALLIPDRLWRLTVPARKKHTR